MAMAFVAMIGSVQASFLLAEPRVAMTIGLLATLLSTTISVVALRRFIAPARIPRRLARLISPRSDRA
jgi:hypothetical protein